MYNPHTGRVCIMRIGRSPITCYILLLYIRYMYSPLETEATKNVNKQYSSERFGIQSPIFLVVKFLYVSWQILRITLAHLM